MHTTPTQSESPYYTLVVQIFDLLPAEQAAAMVASDSTSAIIDTIEEVMTRHDLQYPPTQFASPRERIGVAIRRYQEERERMRLQVGSPLG